MESVNANRLSFKLASAVAFVEVQLPSGDKAIGTAFHVGEGVFVTARHVVEGNQICEIKITQPVPVEVREFFTDVLSLDVSALPYPIDEYEKSYAAVFKEVTGEPPKFKRFLSHFDVERGPYFPENTNLDVAIFKVRSIHPAAAVIKLGAHWDDWVFREHWHLSDAIILGYPPIPMTNEPTLVAAKAQIHTYVVPRHAPAVHFILSAIPRGGFSGGPAVHENGDALGVITSSFQNSSEDVASGFMAVLSIEVIVKCLQENGLWPEVQRKHHEEIMRPRAPKRVCDET